MAIRRKAIKILPHDRKMLLELYVKYSLPIEQLESRPAEMAAFTREWRQLSRQRHSEGELLHYMRNERKNGNWIKLGRNYPPSPPLPSMSADEINSLVMIYEENVAILGKGTDTIAYDEEIGELLCKSFFEMTGRGLPSHDLVRMLTYLRKRGLLTRVSDMPKAEGSGFDEAAEESA